MTVHWDVPLAALKAITAAKLSARDNQIMCRLFVAGETQAAVARSEGVTETRIHQIKTRAMIRVNRAAEAGEVPR